MKKFVLFFMLLVFFGCSGKNNCAHVDLEWLNKQSKLPENVEIIYKKPVDGICEVVLFINGNTVPIYCTQDSFIAGHMVRNNESVTNKTLAELSKVVAQKKAEIKEHEDEETLARKKYLTGNLDSLDSMAAFEFGALDNYKHIIYLVTDPLCSHCKHTMVELHKTALKSDIKVKVIIFPLLGDESLNLAHKAYCNNYGYEDYINIKDDGNPYYCEKADVIFNKERDFFAKGNINFVPVVIEGSGMWVIEGGDEEELARRLGEYK